MKIGLLQSSFSPADAGLGLRIQSLHGVGRPQGGGADRERPAHEERARRARGAGVFTTSRIIFEIL